MNLNSYLKKYLSCFGDLQYFKKGFHSESVYYSNSKKQIIFYDKLKEMANKKETIPDEYKQYKGRVLRYELRFKSRIKDEFNKSVYISDLYNSDFYTSILNKWQEYYFLINRIPKINFNKMAYSTAGIYKDYLLTQFINEKGLDIILNDIDTNRDKFKTSVEASRCKDSIKKLFKNKNYLEPNDLINELDNEVKKAIIY